MLAAADEQQPATEQVPVPARPCHPALVQLIAQAQQVSPVVAAARSRLEAAAGSALQASLKPNPKVAYSAQEIGNEGRAGQHGLIVQQRQVRGNKIPIRTSVAEREFAARTVDVQSETYRVGIATRLAYYRTLVAGRRLQVTRELVQLAEQTVAAINRLVEAEEMSKTAKIQAELAVTNLRTQLIAAQQQYLAGRRSLAALVNTDAAALPEFSCDDFDQLPDYRWPVVAQWARTSLKIAKQRYLVEKAERKLTLQQARQIVDVDWQMSVYYEDATDDVIAGVQVTRPLLWHDWNQGNIGRASAELMAARNDVGSIVQSTLLGLASAYRAYEAQRETAHLLAAEQVPKSREGLELSQAALREGEIGYLEALVSQQTYADANERYFNAIDAAWQAAAQLERQFVD